MKTTLLALTALLPALALAQIAPYPITIDSQVGRAPVIEHFQGSYRTFRVSFEDGGTALNASNMTPVMAWYTNVGASAAVTSSWAWVGSASTGIVDFTFTAGNFNHDAGRFYYVAGLTDSDGNPLIYKQGRLVLQGEAWGSGAALTGLTTNINIALYTWTGTFPIANMPSDLMTNVTGDSWVSASKSGRVVALSGAGIPTAFKTNSAHLAPGPTADYVLATSGATNYWTAGLTAATKALTHYTLTTNLTAYLHSVGADTNASDDVSTGTKALTHYTLTTNLTDTLDPTFTTHAEATNIANYAAGQSPSVFVSGFGTWGLLTFNGEYGYNGVVSGNPSWKMIVTNTAGARPDLWKTSGQWRLYHPEYGTGYATTNSSANDRPWSDSLTWTESSDDFPSTYGDVSALSNIGTGNLSAAAHAAYINAIQRTPIALTSAITVTVSEVSGPWFRLNLTNNATLATSNVDTNKTAAWKLDVRLNSYSLTLPAASFTNRAGTITDTNSYYTIIGNRPYQDAITEVW